MDEETFSFELKENDKLPKDVIEGVVNVINRATRGYVTAQIGPYNGHIETYTRKVNDFASAFTPHEETIEIQNSLGALEKVDHRYEVFLTVKNLDDYKFRIMLVDYGAISYPVTVVLEQQLALKVMNQYDDTFYVENMDQLNIMMNKIIDSRIFQNLIQSLIDESRKRP